VYLSSLYIHRAKSLAITFSKEKTKKRKLRHPLFLMQEQGFYITFILFEKPLISPPIRLAKVY
jgi:hypothetical protein